MDYSELDKLFKWNWKKERLALAKKDGCSCILEHMHKVYLKTKSTKLTGKMCGGLSEKAVWDTFKKAGIEMGQRGGPNRNGTPYLQGLK
jgi:hypothetical protein